MRRITKRFGRVTVLNGVDFDIRGGEVHALAGENGAGKSTLIKILGGVYSDYEGSIEIDGQAVRIASPLDAAGRGISVIHQELSLAANMDVADNIFLGRPPTRFGFVRVAAQRAQAARLLQRLGESVDMNRPVEELPIATRQLIEIAKALRQTARVIVMDEPTSALNAAEVENLFGLIRQLKADGCAIVYITHKMEEIERIADRITVLRDGRLIGSAPAADLPAPKLIQWMVGREMSRQALRRPAPPGEELLRVRDFGVAVGRAGRMAVEGVTFSLRAGEIVGIAGLRGSGNSELLMGLFGGYGRRARGEVRAQGRVVDRRSPARAIRRGIALLTNDRKATGLVLPMSVVENTVLADMKRMSPWGWRRAAWERRAAEKFAADLRLRAASLGMSVGELSGGNQQKVALAKWLQVSPRILLLDEPTRGIDVGAKGEIYELMNACTARGMGILLITSEMPELLAMSDRILVLHRGRMMAEFGRDEASPEKILAAAMGRDEHGPGR
jgi:ABC-type sugar transport system ATPase subunit